MEFGRVRATFRPNSCSTRLLIVSIHGEYVHSRFQLYNGVDDECLFLSRSILGTFQKCSK